MVKNPVNSKKLLAGTLIDAHILMDSPSSPNPFIIPEERGQLKQQSATAIHLKQM
jgi:hypothetical protein